MISSPCLFFFADTPAELMILYASVYTYLFDMSNIAFCKLRGDRHFYDTCT